MSVKAYTSVLKYADTADYATATTWTPVAKAKNLKPNKITSKDIDVTVLDSPDEFEEFIAGLANGGDMTMSLQYAPAQTSTLYGLFRTIKGWRLLYPDGSGWHMNGYINEFGDEEIVNGEIIMTGAKFKVTGKPVKFTTAS